MTVSTDDVASFYDGTDKFSLEGKIDELWGANLHYGYWENSTDEDGPIEAATDRLTDLMIAGLNAQPGQHMLDIGCGNGNPTLRLARTKGVSVVGITISKLQAEQAQARVAELGIADRAEFRLADAMKMPFPDDSFDLAWALESMLHMPDRGQVLAEAARVLRSGGRLAIADVVERGPVGPEGKIVLDHIRSTYKIHSLGTADEYRAHLAANDFVDVEITDITDKVNRTGIVLAKTVEKKRAEFLRHATEQELDSFTDFMRRAAATPENGYLFITATRR
ncbi:SAM-dependent methyltransferase [Nocardia arthritidis]|uniref:Methyltransferase domain-containing protein n=1 Tax=Nocardia arthritidis TaxID=228602 RepID=A0A6C0R4J4_9NOCA|nr:methyltransferase domain-containing protein [Nocardia arthritidis]QHZ99329.1 O-methyltransferase [Nocardia arthritidis]QIS10433.1 methyltransferase domain-containing protein [Nocardia arthritidis]